MSPLVPKAVRVRTSNGWQDIALTGAQGPPGSTPSARGYGNFTYAAADAYHRTYAPALTTHYNTMGGNPFPAGFAFVAPATGKYQITTTVEQFTMGAASYIAVALIRNDVSLLRSLNMPSSPSSDANPYKGGVQMTWEGDLNAGDYLKFQSWCHQGGSATLVIEAIRLDAPPVYLPTSAPMLVTPAQFAALAPVDGLEVYLQADAANGILWHLRYNASSSSAYKWEYLGGPPMSHRVDAAVSNTGGFNGQGGPLVLVPRLGQYRIQFGVRIDRSVIDNWGEVGPAFNNVSPNTDDCVTYFTSAQSAGAHTSRSVPVLTATVDTTTGRTVQLLYITQGSAVLFMRRWLEVTPVRIA